ncbi:hypothetical protein VNO77_41664 [Canavalia gladiata]|uniref:Uncharacterized protein n=1 Tax=Canavalia gladiata TaxID=3824 RepID=A0AAN9JZB2_CANGL
MLIIMVAVHVLEADVRRSLWESRSHVVPTNHYNEFVYTLRPKSVFFWSLENELLRPMVVVATLKGTGLNCAGSGLPAINFRGLRLFPRLGTFMTMIIMVWLAIVQEGRKVSGCSLQPRPPKICSKGQRVLVYFLIGTGSANAYA